LASTEPFSFDLVEDSVESIYRKEKIMTTLVFIAAMISILISCLGLWGLTSLIIERRIKEIGIRKVLGATVLKILVFISMDFLKLVVIANLIAWPLGYLIMENWLQNFAYKIDINWWIYFLVGVLTIIVTILTVSCQSMKAARANPVDSLRYE